MIPPLCWGDGQPQRLFLHCMLGQAAMWRPVAAQLPGTSLAVDLPGHGRQPRWDGTAYHDDALALARAALTHPQVVIGHSFGATVALRLALERPEYVSRLVLVEPVLFAAARGSAAYAPYQDGFAPVVDAMARGDFATAAEYFLRDWSIGRPWHDLPDRIRERLVDQMRYVQASGPSLHDDLHGILARLGQISCPVTLIEGDRSPLVIAAIQTTLQGGLSQVTRHLVPGAGHMLPLTHPDIVAQHVGAGTA